MMKFKCYSFNFDDITAQLMKPNQYPELKLLRPYKKDLEIWHENMTWK